MPIFILQGWVIVHKKIAISPKESEKFKNIEKDKLKLEPVKNESCRHFGWDWKI